MEEQMNVGQGIPAPTGMPGIPETRDQIRENLGTKKSIKEQVEILYEEAKVFTGDSPWIPGDCIFQMDDGPYIMPPPGQACIVLKLIDQWEVRDTKNPVHEPFDLMILTLIRDEPQILIVHSRYFYQEELVVEVE